MEIKQYLKDKNNHKIGMVLAKSVKNEVRIGFSKCNTVCDKFDRDRAVKIARVRAEKFSDQMYNKYNVPSDVEKIMPEFIDRCKRFYKDKILPEWSKNFENHYIVHEEA